MGTEDEQGVATWPGSALRPLAAQLSALGYAVAYRHDGFSECLVTSGAERWLGRGASAEEALGDALRAMFPSRASRALLLSAPLAEPRRAVEPFPAAHARSSATAAENHPYTHARAAAADTEPHPAAQHTGSPEPHGGPSEQRTGPSEQRTGPSEQRTVLSEQRTVLSEQRTVLSEQRTMLDLPALRSLPPSSQATQAYIAVPVVEQTPRATVDPDTACADVADLLTVVENRRIELALMSRERQRLQLLGWICHARAIQDASGRHPKVVAQVTEVARRLGTLAKLWWPGSVNALQVDATPAEVGKELNISPRDRVQLTWAAAAELAEQRLREVEDRDEAAGLDEYGWADAGKLEPAPVSPSERLADLRRFLERVAGPLDRPPGAATDEVRRPTGELRDSIMRWARLARWLRGSTADFALWGTTIGRIRWLAVASQSAPLLQLIDERYSPTRSWAADLREDPEAKRQQQQRKTIVKGRPHAGAAPEIVRAWVLEALGVLPPERILNHVTKDHRDLVLELKADGIEERRHRRHLKRLQELLGGPPAVAEAGDTPPTVDGIPIVDFDDEGDATDRVPRDQELLSAVKPFTEGRTALFVSNREDPQLRQRLESTFAFSMLDWSDGTPRRLQELEARIAGGRYDLVLGATGFQSHTMDAQLLRACRRADVRYVRVHRGRQLACILGLARELGIATDGVSGVAA